ncbi:MAG: alpha/beta fold hydrolase [Sphingobacteriales bacterium]|nr:alpha/beta fold hydrolase [Sphingobacteriales bacterium]
MKLHFKQYGDRHTNRGHLIILHGLLGMLDNWQLITKDIAAAGFCVWAVDLRNHGKSPHSEEMTQAAMAHDIWELMQAQQIPKAALLGHSMGGKVAMLFAVHYPEYTQALIVADIAPKPYPDRHDYVFKALLSVDLAQLTQRKAAEAQLQQYITNTDELLFLLKNLERTPQDNYRWKANVPLLQKEYRNIVENPLSPYDEYGGAVLFIKGGNSAQYIVAEEDMPVILHHFPRAELVEVAGASHWVHADAPQIFTQVVLDFLCRQVS